MRNHARTLFIVVTVAAALALALAQANAQLSMRGSEWVRLRSAARLILGWRVGVSAGSFGKATFFEAVDQVASPLFLRVIEGASAQKVSPDIQKNLDYNLTASEVEAVRRKLAASGVQMVAYSVDSIGPDETAARKVFEFAKSLNLEILTIGPAFDSRMVKVLDKLANEFAINVALRSAAEGSSNRIGVWAEPTRAGELAPLKDRVFSVRLNSRTDLRGVVREMYRLEMNPMVLLVDGADPATILTGLESAMQPVATERVEQLSRVEPMKGPERLTAEVRAKIEQAAPRHAPARPKKRRKLLVMDLTIAYPPTDHLDSGSAANLALRLAGSKSGAFEAIFSNDIANLKYERLNEFDAVYLNNTVGQVFLDPEVRASLIRYVREGGGLAGHHGTSHAAQDWPEFGEMLGARGGSHKSNHETVTIHLDDPKNPLTASFQGRDFEFTDEFYRFMPEGPYSREKVHVLMSIDTAKTDMNQLPGCPQCQRPDNDYAISWIRNYGKGRIFYLSLGHNPTIFMTPAFFEHVLAGIQFVLGDLAADAKPSSPLRR